jgi:hypothetical protein
LKAGGTADIDAVNNDLSQIVDGNYATLQLLQLPLNPAFNAQTPGSFFQQEGARPDLATPSGANPIIGQLQPTRFQLQQPANALHLVWQALDADGNFQCSYPLNAGAHCYAGSGGPFGFLDTLDWSAAGPQSFWAMGWIRLNGMGAWIQVSLHPSWMHKEAPIPDAPAVPTGNYTEGAGAVLPMGGVASVAGPISFFDWIGYWDGLGILSQGPNGRNAFILAMASINISVSTVGDTGGNLKNYAVPNATGRIPGQQSTQAGQKAGDILVPAGGKRGCP